MQSTLENQNQRTNPESESAFDTNGPAKTMPPREFSLTTSESPDKVSEENSNLESEGDQFNVRQVFSDYIKRYEETKRMSHLEPAARLVMQYYGMYDENLIHIKIVNSADGDEFAATVGNYGANQQMELLVTPLALTSGFETAARILGHEYQHMLYFWNNEDGTDQESEFLAYYFELFENTFASHPGESKLPPVSGSTFPAVPAHNDSDRIVEAIGYAFDYYRSLSPELKEKYSDKKEKLDKLGMYYDLHENSSLPNFRKRRH